MATRNRSQSRPAAFRKVYDDRRCARPKAREPGPPAPTNPRLAPDADGLTQNAYNAPR